MSQFAFPPPNDRSNSTDPMRDFSSEAAPDHRVDRRKKRRALISCPVRVRVRNSSTAGPDEVSSTLDVSRNGILFVTSNRNFHRGMEVALTLPYSRSSGVQQSEQFGSVVRISALPNEQVAVAVALGLSGFLHPEVSPSASKRGNGATHDPKCRKPLILLVDADLPTRDSLKGYLSAQGYRVIAVGDAAEGRDVLNAVTPALVIAEIEGEGLPGFDLCVHVKATPRLRHIPVMLTTKSAYPTDYSNAHSLGAVVCIAKPYRQERVGHVVHLLAPLPQTETKRALPGSGHARRKS